MLFGYNRPDHFRQTVQQLLQCPEAAHSELYVFVDGPRTPADAAAVAAVQHEARHIGGFRQVYHSFSEKNRGLAAAVIAGVSQVISRAGRVIVMEDDLTCSADFLTFMNEALDFYENDPRVFSVSGYLYPIAIPADYPHEVLLVARGSSLGWGTWADRWQKVDWEITDYEVFMQDAAAQRAFTQAGEDLLPMLQRYRQGKISSWAIRWSYAHLRHQAYNLHARHSKIGNIGGDGSGTHAVQRGMAAVQPAEGRIALTAAVQPDAGIHRRLRQYFRLSPYRKLLNCWEFRKKTPR